MSQPLLIILLTFLLTLTACQEGKNLSDEGDRRDYIVVLKDKQVQIQSQSLGSRVSTKSVVQTMMTEAGASMGLQAKKVFSTVLRGGVMSMTSKQASDLLSNENIAYVEVDHIVSINNAVQLDPPWGLDRVDQGDDNLDDEYAPPRSGEGVNIYIIDTGIRTTHEDFGGRALHGYDAIDDDFDVTDCNGHGTHVAGTAGGSEYGVAKDATLYGVRVLDCLGSGSYSNVIEGVEWVTNNHIKPAVANMSLGGPVSQALDDAIKASIQAGVSFVVAAGNDNTDACNGSPARVGATITVGASTQSDRRSSFSNYGECVNVFAPGSEIKSTWYRSDTSTDTLDGTSMASPHVAGVAALYLESQPNASPSEVKAMLLNGAVSGALSDVRSGSPNLLVNVNFISAPNSEEPGDDEVEDPPVVDPPEIPEEDDGLSNGDEILLTGEQGSEQYHQLVLPEGASQLKVTLSGGSGDADLYLKQGGSPSASDYDCRPYVNGNEESCSFENPSSATIGIMVRGFRAYSNVKLRVEFEEPDPTEEEAPCSGCTQSTGELSGSGEREVYPEFDHSEGTLTAILSGPSESDFDLELEHYENGQWKRVANSISLSSNENINYIADPGRYRWTVLSYRGSGEYVLWSNK